MRIPVARRTSTVAHDQNAASSSWVRLRRLPVATSVTLTRPDGPGRRRWNCCPATVNTSAGRGIAGGGDALFGVFALLLDGAQERGQQRQLRPGPLVHPRLDPDWNFFVAHSAALTGHGATQGAHRAGSSAAQRAMSS